MGDSDLFTISRPAAEEAYEIELNKAEYCRKLKIGFYDYDASNPGNCQFIKHGDSKSLQGADQSTITGSHQVYESSQSFVSCTPDETLLFQFHLCNGSKSKNLNVLAYRFFIRSRNGTPRRLLW